MALRPAASLQALSSVVALIFVGMACGSPPARSGPPPLVSDTERPTAPAPPGHAVSRTQNAPLTQQTARIEGASPEQRRRDHQEAHQHAARRQLGRALQTSPELHPVALENPKALERFFTQLRSLETRTDPNEMLRIAVYGSSSTAGDRYTGYLRAYLQHRFGDGGPGFITLAPLWKWHRHQDLRFGRVTGFRADHALKPRGPRDQSYGLMGVRTISQEAHGHIELELRREPLSHWELWYEAGPRAGSFTTHLDGGAQRVQSTRAPAPSFERVVIGDGQPHQKLVLKALGNGPLKLFGAVLETEPESGGIVVDELGIGGSGLRRWVKWDEATWAEQIRQRAPALVVLAYGGIEAMHKNHDRKRWNALLNAAIDRLERHIPEADCLLLTAGDRALRGPGDARQRPESLDGIIAEQRAVALARACAVFDTHAMMGGADSMPRWVAAKLAQRDHVHLTPEGYAHMGRALVDALMDIHDG